MERAEQWLICLDCDKVVERTRVSDDSLGGAVWRMIRRHQRTFKDHHCYRAMSSPYVSYSKEVEKKAKVVGIKVDKPEDES